MSEPKKVVRVADAGVELALLILDTSGLNRELYLKAAVVMRLQDGKAGRPTTLSMDGELHLIDFIEQRLQAGESLASAAQVARSIKPWGTRFDLSERAIENIYRDRPVLAKRSIAK
jgi:hypothetical protein